MQRAWCICGIIIIIVMSLKLYVRRYDPPLALLRVINISMNPSSGPTSTNANKFNNDGYWKWKHMMWWDVNPVVRTGYFDVFVHANNYLRFDLCTIIIIMFVHVSEMSGSECQDNPLALTPGITGSRNPPPGHRCHALPPMVVNFQEVLIRVRKRVIAFRTSSKAWMITDNRSSSILPENLEQAARIISWYIYSSNWKYIALHCCVTNNQQSWSQRYRGQTSMAQWWHGEHRRAAEH